MGLRFHRSINLGRGFRINLSKSGPGISFGKKGARVGIGPRGLTRTVGIPGTGIYYTDTTSLKQRNIHETSKGAGFSDPNIQLKPIGGFKRFLYRFTAVLFFIMALFVLLCGFALLPLCVFFWIGTFIFVICGITLLKKAKKKSDIKVITGNPEITDISDSSVFSPEPLLFKTELINYKVHAKNKSTNRFRTVQILAESKEQCESMAAGQDLLPPYDIEEIPPRMPSDRQLNYARELRINFPDDITFNEISDLIDRKIKKDRSSPKEGLAEFALSHGLHFSRFIGKNQLYNLIFLNLGGKDKIAFFIFCVYRWLSDDRDSNLDKHKYKDVFYAFANENASNEAFLQSMNRYSGDSIKFFGTIKCSNGKYIGGSVDTIAYKMASEYIFKTLGIQNRVSKILN